MVSLKLPYQLIDYFLAIIIGATIAILIIITASIILHKKNDAKCPSSGLGRSGNNNYNSIRRKPSRSRRR